jgi:hypothetical protein
MSDRIIYKVLKSNMTSFNVRSEFMTPLDPRRKLCLQYHEGIWTKPLLANSKLFAFDSIENAVGMLEKLGNQPWDNDYVICKAFGKNVKEVQGSIPDSNDAEDFWKGKIVSKRYNYEGSLFASEIKIIGKITPIFKLLTPSRESSNHGGDVDIRRQVGTILRYTLNKWTRPKIEKSKLFVFKKLNDAIVVKKTQMATKLDIYKGYGLNVNPLDNGIPNIGSHDEIINFWQNGREYSRYHPSYFAGTVLSDEVMITGKI